jgi:hypothetical protein
MWCCLVCIGPACATCVPALQLHPDHHTAGVTAGAVGRCMGGVGHNCLLEAASRRAVCHAKVNSCNLGIVQGIAG